VETDHDRLKSRLQPIRRLKRRARGRRIAAGNAFVPNLRRGRYELTVDVQIGDRIRVAADSQ